MSQDKIAESIADLRTRVETVQRDGKKVVLCHGVFDLLHPGHLLHLQAARKFGDYLIVTITPDRHVNKGPGRPVFNERLRSIALAGLEVVDHVAVNEWPTAVETIEWVRPNVYVKGNDYSESANDVTGGIDRETAAVRSVGGDVKFTNEDAFSSSNLINRFFSPYSDDAGQYLEELRSRYSADEVIEKLQSYSSLRPLVVGEAILDEYCYATPLAKAPREAIIAVRYESVEVFGGGAIATANHLAGFCDQVTLVTPVGEDEDHFQTIAASLRSNVDLVSIVTPDRTTVRKRRFLEPGHLTKLFEIQYIDDRDLSEESERQAAAALTRLLPDHDLAVVNDFGHGFMTPKLRELVSGSPTFLALNTQTNSANLGFNPITRYQSAQYCCIDQAEANLAARDKHATAAECAAQLIGKMGAESFMTTTGRSGSVLTLADGTTYECPAFSPNVVDRVGAGDAVFALTSPWAYRDHERELMTFVGNCVGAIKVAIVGNRSSVEPVPLFRFISTLLN
jgi:rfaE bifunctional protein nucleotidyltransferase chain/domain